MDGTADVKRAKEEISELENISEEISRIKNRRKKGWNTEERVKGRDACDWNSERRSKSNMRLISRHRFKKPYKTWVGQINSNLAHHGETGKNQIQRKNIKSNNKFLPRSNNKWTMKAPKQLNVTFEVLQESYYQSRVLYPMRISSWNKS